MNHSVRVLNLQHVSRELDMKFLDLWHREQVLSQSLVELAALRTQMSDTKKMLNAAQTQLASVLIRLPSLARAEALQRVQQRLDASPFEEYVQSSRSRQEP